MDLLTHTAKAERIQRWSEQIDTANARLTAAAANASAAVSEWDSFIALATPEDRSDTGAAVAAKLLSTEDASLTAISTLCRTFAAGTGQTVA